MPSRRTSPRSITWIHCTDRDASRLRALHAQFPHLDARDLRDCLPPQQRSKTEIRADTLFTILLFPRYDRAEHAIRSEEVDIFVLPRTVITMHENTIPVFTELDAAVRNRDPEAVEALRSSEDFVLLLLERLIAYCSPILVHLQNDIEEQEREVRAHIRAHQLIRIALLRRNIVAFRRAFLPNIVAIERLSAALAPRRSATQELRFTKLLDATREITALLEDYASAMSDLHAAQQSLVTYQTNRVSTALAIIGVLTFPISMIAAILAIRADGTPLVDDPNGFWSIVGGMTAVAVGMLGYFKSKRWL
ncbi:hypothetical protein HY632_02160 [Candidatus Uhrbacteria bacterium]|nr:hypothetical protein [Candidatus Uhrbacteria bacterium]